MIVKITLDRKVIREASRYLAENPQSGEISIDIAISDEYEVNCNMTGTSDISAGECGQCKQDCGNDCYIAEEDQEYAKAVNFLKDAGLM